MSVRTVLCAGALFLAGGYLLFSCLGPDGIPMVLEKRRQIRELQEEKSELERQIRERKGRIEAFNRNAEKRRESARERLGKIKKGETVFLYPDR